MLSRICFSPVPVSPCVKRDLLQCQKRPTTVSKETHSSVKRDLLQCQKRPTKVLFTCSCVSVPRPFKRRASSCCGSRISQKSALFFLSLSWLWPKLLSLSLSLSLSRCWKVSARYIYDVKSLERVRLRIRMCMPGLAARWRRSNTLATHWQHVSNTFATQNVCLAWRRNEDVATF